MCDAFLLVSHLFCFLFQPLPKYRVPSYVCKMPCKMVPMPHCETGLKEGARKETNGFFIVSHLSLALLYKVTLRSLSHCINY